MIYTITIKFVSIYLEWCCFNFRTRFLSICVCILHDSGMKMKLIRVTHCKYYKRTRVESWWCWVGKKFDVVRLSDTYSLRHNTQVKVFELEQITNYLCRVLKTKTAQERKILSCKRKTWWLKWKTLRLTCVLSLTFT